jgi:N-sulfoglucosamine sulfohydrolase
LLVFSGVVSAQANGPAAGRRNVVLLIADDLGMQVGCYGDAKIRTPNIDGLAARGTRFTEGFATVSSCSPSRAVILTGLFTHTNGQYGLAHAAHHAVTFENVKSLPARLKQAGYRTGVIGKLHVLPPSVYPWDEKVEGKEIGGNRDVDAMAERVGQFAARDADKPFFLLVGFSDPHRAAGGFANKGKLDVASERYKPENVIVPPFLPDKPDVREDLAQYYQSITRMDRGVGLVLETLKKAGVADDTLVIFLSDNGMPFPGAKTNLYDPGVHLPLIIASPKQSKRGVVNDSFASWVDVTPTILDWAGVKGGPNLPGRSLLGELEREHAPDGPDAVFGSHVQHEVTMYYPMRSIRTRKYKYILNIASPLEVPTAEDLFNSVTWQGILTRHDTTVGQRSMDALIHRAKEELYDLESDPGESKNLAADPASARVLGEMRRRMKQWQEKTRDPWALKYEHE